MKLFRGPKSADIDPTSASQLVSHRGAMLLDVRETTSGKRATRREQRTWLWDVWLPSHLPRTRLSSPFVDRVADQLELPHNSRRAASMHGIWLEGCRPGWQPVFRYAETMALQESFRDGSE